MTELADLPAVTVHFAQTLDGRIATRTGDARWISCDATLKFAHQLRADHDAVMVGIGTALQDNPALTVRHVSGPSPARIVLDTQARLPLDSQLASDGLAQTIVASTARAPTDRIDALRRVGVEVLLIPERERLVDLRDLLYQLAQRAIGSILVEGGSGLITSLLRDQLVQRLSICIAPKIIGAGIDAIGDLGVLRLDQALQFSHHSVTSLGDDIVFDGKLAFKSAAGLAGNR